MLLLQLQNQRFDLEGQTVGLTVRPAAAIGQPFQSALSVSIEDLMAGFAGDIELPTQHRHLLAFQQPGHESESLVHFGTLLPRHLRLPQMPESVTYVSGMICNLKGSERHRRRGGGSRRSSGP